MARKKRIAAILVALLFGAAVLLSAFFIAAEANHNCAGDNCSVCGFIYACGNILRIFGGAVIGSLPVLPALFSRIGFNGAAVNTHRTFSLFAQKEMLLN